MPPSHPIHLPTELRAKILSSVLSSPPDSTPWRLAHALRNIRLINRAWCTSANEVLFTYVAIFVERNLGYEVERIRKIKELSRTGLGVFVREFEVLLSPGYCRYQFEEEDDGEATERLDVLDILACDIPSVVSGFPNLTSLAFTLPTRDDSGWKRAQNLNPNDVDWDRFPLDCQEQFYRTVHACLSGAPLPNLRTLSLDLFESCDLDILTLAERQARNSFFSSNLSQLTSLTLTIKRGRAGHRCPSASENLESPVRRGHLFNAAEYASFFAEQPHSFEQHTSEICISLVDFLREVSCERWRPGLNDPSPYRDLATRIRSAFPHLLDLTICSASPEADLELREHFVVAEDMPEEKEELKTLPIRSLTLSGVAITYLDVISLLRRMPDLEYLCVHSLEGRMAESIRTGTPRSSCLDARSRVDAIRDVVAKMERLEWDAVDIQQPRY